MVGKHRNEVSNSRGVTQLATLISKILNPQYVAIPLFWFVSHRSSSGFTNALRWFAICTCSIIIPVFLFTTVQVKRGHFTDAHVSVRQQRTQLYIFGGTWVLICLIMAIYLHAPPAVIAMLLAMLVSNSVAMLINLFWKVSVHTGGITGAAVVLIILFGTVALPMILLVFLMGWARFTLKKHTISQIVAGALVAAIITVLVFYLFGLL